jgi:hypothetical protein
MKITFPKKPQFYDSHNTPYYFSKCNKYRLLHFRTGFVQKNGKCKHDVWCVHYNTSKGKDIIWKSCAVVVNFVPSKKKAKKAAREHDLFLRAEKAVAKKMKRKK